MNPPPPSEPNWTPPETRGTGTSLWALPENFLLCAALALMVAVPLAEAAMRATLPFGISGAASITQHLTLAVGMVGGAVAARQSRLLSLATTDLLPGNLWKHPARVFAAGFAAAMTVLLTVASWEFVLQERQAGKELAYGFPVWIVQLLIPVCFGLTAVRIVWLNAGGWMARASATALAGLISCACLCEPLQPEQAAPYLLMGLVAATALGAPIFTALGGAAWLLFWGAGEVVAGVPIEHYRLAVNPTLPTLPLFTLAGYFLAEGGASKRLVRVMETLVGQFPSGPALVTVLVCAFFTTFTGASGVTILALGGLLYPVLIQERYSERATLGLLTGCGSLGLLFPPCLPLILYGVIANVSIEKMFLGGILPGVLMLVLTAWWGARSGPQSDQRPPFHWPSARQALWDAKWELVLPFVVLGSMFSGFATPVDSAAITALYAFLTQTVIHRDLDVRKDGMRVMVEAGLLVGGVLLILGVALGFTNYLVDAQIPSQLVDWAQGSIESKWVFLLALNGLLLIVGCLMDVYSALVVVVPLIAPLGAAFGVDPVHLGIIFLANLEMGFLTPPVGMNLFLSSYRFNKPVHEVYRAAIPMLVVLGGGVILITYVPILTTFLPSFLKR